MHCTARQKVFQNRFTHGLDTGYYPVQTSNFYLILYKYLLKKLIIIFYDIQLSNIN